MVVKDMELPYTLTAELTANEIAVAITEHLIRRRGWPAGVRYDNTVLTLGIGVKPSVFKVEVSAILPDGKPGDTIIQTPRA